MRSVEDTRILVPGTMLPDEPGQYQYSLGSTLERMKYLRLGRDQSSAKYTVKSTLTCSH